MLSLKTDLLNTFKGFIFDIDGTMVDSMKMHLKSWQKLLENYDRHMSIKEIGEQAYGINPEIVKRLLGDHLTDEEVDWIADEKEEIFRNSFDPEEDVIKGFIQFIDAIRAAGKPMVIGSAAPPENVEFFTQRLGIKHYFEGVVHEDDVTLGKPSPEVFIKAAAILNLPNDQCIVFEDSPTGAEAADKAGSKTIALLTTKGKSDFKDIPGIIEYIKDYTELLP